MRHYEKQSWTDSQIQHADRGTQLARGERDQVKLWEMKDNTENITIASARDFRYEVTIEYRPQFGVAYAKYRGGIIADCQLSRITKPISDDDYEWEQYHERFAEWRDEILSNLKPACVRYFNQQEEEQR